MICFACFVLTKRSFNVGISAIAGISNHGNVGFWKDATQLLIVQSKFILFYIIYILLLLFELMSQYVAVTGLLTVFICLHFWHGLLLTEVSGPPSSAVLSPKESHRGPH